MTVIIIRARTVNGCPNNRVEMCQGTGYLRGLRGAPLTSHKGKTLETHGWPRDQHQHHQLRDQLPSCTSYLMHTQDTTSPLRYSTQNAQHESHREERSDRPMLRGFCTTWLASKMPKSWRQSRAEGWFQKQSLGEPHAVWDPGWEPGAGKSN